MRIKTILTAIAGLSISVAAHSQAWRNCVPNSYGPGGCESAGPGGGRSLGPGGGMSFGPGGGMSAGPGGGQSLGPGGGQSMGPGGGLGYDRDKSRGFDTTTMQPFPQNNPWLDQSPMQQPSFGNW